MRWTSPPPPCVSSHCWPSSPFGKPLSWLLSLHQCALWCIAEDCHHFLGLHSWCFIFLPPHVSSCLQLAHMWGDALICVSVLNSQLTLLLPSGYVISLGSFVPPFYIYAKTLFLSSTLPTPFAPLSASKPCWSLLHPPTPYFITNVIVLILAFFRSHLVC